MQQRVADRGRGVDRLLVAEAPRPGAAGVLPGLPGVVLVVIAVLALGQVGEHLPQRGLAQPAHGLRGELQLAVVALQVALPLQFPLDLAQRLHVVDRLAAERAPHRLLVDVVEPGARVVLAQRVLELGQVGELGQRGGRVAQAERILAGHLLARPAVEVHVRPAGPQRTGQPGHLRGQPGVLEGLRHQPGQLVALLVGQRVEQPLRGRHPPDQRVDQLLEVARRVGEQVPVLLHEVVEVLLRVLVPGVGVQHLVERGHHVLDPLHGLGVGLLQGLPHAAELAVQHLAPQQVLELLERLPGRGRPPVVVGQLPDGLRGVGGQRVQLGLAQPGLVVRVGEQLGPLLADRGVQQRPGLLQDAVQPAAAAQLALAFAHPAEQVAQAPVPGHALAQQVAQRAGGIGALEHRLAELVQRAAHVIGRLERVGPVPVLAVAVALTMIPAPP